jgi:2,4-dienoyl-CoA reductase-like NADH-dependent reductase (Old Yellow Enzyme family)
VGMTQGDKYPALCALYVLQPVALLNRFAMPAMHRGRCLDGAPTQHMADRYARRAEGEIALIITESCVVDHASAARGESLARMPAAMVSR